MTSSIPVSIPADVLGNSPHTVRVTSDGVRAEEGGVPAAKDLKYYRDTFRSLGFTLSELDKVSEDGHRTVNIEFRQYGRVVKHFRTEYFTRVDCARCVPRWAQAYVVVAQDGEPVGDPEPLCGDHIALERARVRHGRDAGLGLTLHASVPLRIGQH